MMYNRVSGDALEEAHGIIFFIIVLSVQNNYNCP